MFFPSVTPRLNEVSITCHFFHVLGDTLPAERSEGDESSGASQYRFMNIANADLNLKYR